VGTAPGVVTVSEELSFVAGVVAATSGVLAGSEDLLAVTAGAPATATAGAETLRERSARRVGGAASAAGLSQGVLAVVAGATVGVTVVSAGGVANGTGVRVGSAGVVTVAAIAPAPASAAGVIAVSGSVLVLVVGAAAEETAAAGAGGAAGVLAVSEVVLTATVGAAAGAQCSEIMVSSVTAKLLSAAAELVPLALCPISVTSWPRCCLRSTPLVVILKVRPVPSSETV